MDIVERFLNYVSFDTQSAEDSQTSAEHSQNSLILQNISEMNSRTRALMMLRWTTTATFMPH